MASLLDKNGTVLTTEEDTAALVVEKMLSDDMTDYSQMDKACLEHVFKLIYIRKMTRMAVDA